MAKAKKLVLSQDEIDESRDAFTTFDKDRSGTIDIWELRQVLEGASALLAPLRPPPHLGTPPRTAARELTTSLPLPPPTSRSHGPAANGRGAFSDDFGGR